MIRKHLSYANVMSSIAVFLLLGGGAAIAANQKQKRIGTNQIKASAITAGKIKDGAVTNSKLADGSVTSSKIVDGSISNSKLQSNSVGGNQLQGDSVTGDKVVESSLSEVPSASSANPVAFAKVAANGVLDGGASKGITSVNVSHSGGTGVYCVSIPSFAPRGAQVTTVSGVAATTAQANVGEAPCSASSVKVATFTSPAVAADEGFYLVVYR